MPPETAINARLRACGTFNCQWACALLPSPAIFSGPSASGGATILAANSAALWELADMSIPAMETLGRTYADWLDERIEAKKAPPTQWHHDMAIDALSGRRQVMVYDFVYRELERRVGGAAIEEMLGAAALWDFAQRGRNEQFTAIHAAVHRHHEQQQIDREAIATLERIYAAA